MPDLMISYEFAKDFAGPMAVVVGSIAVAGVAVTFGFIQANIARAQADTAGAALYSAQRRLAVDLFDKRWEIVSEVSEAIRKVAAEQKVSRTARDKFVGAAERARFLFGPEVDEFLISIDEALKALLSAEQLKDSAILADRNIAAQAEVLAVKNLKTFFRDFDKLLTPYMAMHDKLPGG